MGRIVRVFRIVLINIAVFVGAWMAALVVVSVGADLARFGKALRDEPTDARALLPVYPDKDRAKKIYVDMKQAELVYVPFVEWRRKPFNSDTVNVDPDGLRTWPTRGDGPINLGFFGGSAMWGTGVEDIDTIPAIFDALTDGYRVTNYAEIAWTSRQSLEALINLIHDRNAPDVVVFYDGANDVSLLCDNALTTTADGHGQHLKMRDRLAKKPVSSAIYENLVAPLIRVVSGGEREGVEDYQCARDPSRAERVARTMIDNWVLAHDLVRSYGGRFFAFLQPNAFVGSPQTDYLNDQVNRNWEARDVVRKEFAAVYPLIQEKARALPWVVDLTRAFDGPAPVYVDSVHVTRTGNEIIARRMAHVLGSALVATRAFQASDGGSRQLGAPARGVP